MSTGRGNRDSYSLAESPLRGEIAVDSGAYAGSSINYYPATDKL